ncbi:MAG: TonB-dependent receptor [Prolixibacteraceae bacterium]|nr:TonB-dependent receptor [Prolixibacteraceae bacterium]
MKIEKNEEKSQKHFRSKMLIAILMFFAVSFTYAQEHTLRGFVSDEMKMPIPGANVVIKGTTTGTVTDSEGKFILQAPASNSVIVVSFVGYQAQEVGLNGETSVNIVLKELKAELDNIIVVGYGIQKKSDLTGSVATVSSDQMLKTSSVGAVQALQGKAAGVQVFQSSGMPGAPITVRVRGINTITKKDEWSGVAGPIYIIDGIPGDINSINPNDIKSIEVLKDASSQAIYGSSGGNGVILVTTKQGSKNQKPKLELSMYRGLQSNDIRVQMCDTKEFIQIYNSLETTKRTRITADPNSLPSTNWWNEISQNALMEDYNLSISSGTENSTSLFSIGYLNQEGVVQKTEYKRYNIRVNTTYNIAKWLKVGENISLAVTRNSGNDGWGSPMGAINQSPISYVRDTSSNLTAQQIKDMNIGWGGWAQPLFGTGAGNPVAGIYYDNNRSGTYRMAGNLFANVQLLKGLTYNNNFGFDINFYENDNFQPYYYITSTQNNSVVQVSRTLNRNFSWNWQHVVNYNTTLFEKHDIDLMAGFEASEYLGKTLSGSADSLLKNGVTPEYQYIDATLRQSGSLYYKAGGGFSHSSRFAYFGRVNYQYNNIFLAQFSCRYDGSTNFAPAHRFGLFPAFSTGFKFSELEIVKENLTFLSFGKVRFGWGITGNDGIPGNKFYSLVGVSAVNGYPFGGSGTPGGIALAPGNQELHWETITTYNYGIDLNFFDNKLSVVADYFNKNTSGMLQSLALPLVVGRYGFSGSDGKYTDHIGSLSNKGVEFAAAYKDKVGELKYSVDFNITKIVSKLYNLTDTFTLPDWDSNPKSILRNGDAPGAFWGYKTDGLFRPENAVMIVENGRERLVWDESIPYKTDSKGNRVYAQNSAKPGDQRFVDTNGDFSINNLDKVVIGNPNPDFTFGMTINLEYKNFDMSCFFQGSYGNDIFNASKAGWYNSTGLGNWTKDALNAYRAPTYDTDGTMIDPGNTTSNQFRLFGSTVDNYRISDWYVEDGSYVRLKAMQLGYTLPESFTQRFGIERLRVYVGGRNLVTWTNYSGLDPETGGNDPTYFGVDGGSYPQPKMYNVGVNVTF